MKELEYLKIINETLNDSSLLGDDCACLSGLSDKSGRQICVTQDTLVEGVHFLLDTTTPFKLGQKAVNVNLSDLAAAGAEPLYLMISLSLPKTIGGDFVKSFYEGVQFSIQKLSVIVAGGDLTASDNVCISICAIGRKYNDVNISRSCAKAGDIIAVTGTHGGSAGGLRLLANGENASKPLIDKNTDEKPDEKNFQTLIQKHLVPIPQTDKSRILMQAAQECGVKSIAMMDSSDGLGDALYKLSQGCGLAFDIDYSSIPVDEELKMAFPDGWTDMALWGGEDFQLVFCADKSVFEKPDKNEFYKIGTVTDKPFASSGLQDKIKEEFERKSYRHF